MVTSIEVHGLVDIEGVEYKTWAVYPESKPETIPFEIAIGEGQTDISEESLVSIIKILWLGSVRGCDQFQCQLGFNLFMSVLFGLRQTLLILLSLPIQVLFLVVLLISTFPTMMPMNFNRVVIKIINKLSLSHFHKNAIT